MKRYRVEFSEGSKQDIVRSFEWGRKEWGAAAALRWYRSLKEQARKLLTYSPMGAAIAPESAEMGREIRQMVFGRYRVLFEVIGRTVRVLHVRGAFVDKARRDIGVDE